MRKNLIYTAVFKKSEYVDLTCLLLKSIHLFSNIKNANTDILIYTTKEFANEICNRVSEYKLPIFFDIFDESTITCIFQLCCFRLQIFNNNYIRNYDKILYVDTDILINGDITKLFSLEIDIDKIYAIEEGCIDHIFYGGNFFDFEKIDRKTTAFSSGIMLFKNTPIMADLFNDTNNHIWHILNTDQRQILFYDQPFITYNFISRKKYNNKLLNKYAKNNPTEIDSEVIIYHFPGTVGEYDLKCKKMEDFLQKRIEYENVLNNKDVINISISSENIKTENIKKESELKNLIDLIKEEDVKLDDLTLNYLWCDNKKEEEDCLEKILKEERNFRKTIINALDYICNKI